MSSLLLWLVVKTCLLSFMSCSENASVQDKLAGAEKLMTERPDSALIVLQSIDERQLKSRRLKAEHSLLMSIAYDKNYIDLTSDTLIRRSVEYYAKSKDYERKFMSYYYCGRVQSNGGHYAKAMLSYAKAEELSDKIDNPFYLGLLYFQLGIIHEKVYDFHRSLKAYMKAYDFYYLSDTVSHQFYAKMCIGKVLLYLKNYDQAEKYLTEAMHWAYDNNDYVCQSCAETLIMLYEEQGNENALLSLYQSPYVMDCKDDMIMMQSLAFVHAYENDADKALSYMDKAWSLAKRQNDTIILKSKEYRIHKLLGNTEKALEEYEELFYLQDSIVRKTLQQPILSVQNEYFQSQAKYNELRLSHNRSVIIYTFIALALIISFAIFFIRQRMIQKNDEINRYIEVIQDLETSLFSKNKDINQMTSDIKQMNHRINVLFLKQFDLIDKLSNTYYETHNTTREKEAIYTQVKKEIEHLRSDKKYLAQLEDIVNEYKNNIMRIAREEMTEFKEMDFRLLCFFYAGFSAKAISIFTGDSRDNIYVKKSRLKVKILQSRAKNKDYIIKYLA